MTRGLPKLINTISRSMSSSGASNSSRSRPYTVIVEGNIGAGKTTFLQPFKKHENIVQVVTEPVDKWRNLQGHNLLQCQYLQVGNLPLAKKISFCIYFTVH